MSAMSAVPPDVPLPSDAAEGAPAQASPVQPVRLALQVGTIMRALIGCTVGLLALHLLAVWSMLSGWRFPGGRLFYFDTEGNLPTVYSMLLLVMAALLLACIAAGQLQRRARFAFAWLALSLVFLGMAVDEVASIHESLTHPLRRQLGLAVGGWLHFSWVVVGAAVVLVLGIAFLPFLLRLPPDTRRRFVLAGFLYVGGALGMELVGGRTFVEQGEATLGLSYAVASTAEELLELAGLLVFIRALLLHLRDYAPELHLRLEG